VAWKMQEIVIQSLALPFAIFNVENMFFSKFWNLKK
jgi:hypothetical protein